MFTLSSSIHLTFARSTPSRSRRPRDRRPAALVSVTMVAVAIAACAALAGTAVVVTAALLVGAAAAIVDARSGRLPNRLVALVAWAATAAAATAPSPSDAAIGAALGAACLAGPLLVVHLLAPPAMGFGDVKLAAALGAAIGPLDPLLGLVALCGATGTTAAVGVVTRRHALPLGPGLVAGAALAVATRSVWS